MAHRNYLLCSFVSRANCTSWFVSFVEWGFKSILRSIFSSDLIIELKADVGAFSACCGLLLCDDVLLKGFIDELHVVMNSVPPVF